VYGERGFRGEIKKPNQQKRPDYLVFFVSLVCPFRDGMGVAPLYPVP
jgi:hypothetical protein